MYRILTRASHVRSRAGGCYPTMPGRTHGRRTLGTARSSCCGSEQPIINGKVVRELRSPLVSCCRSAVAVSESADRSRKRRSFVHLANPRRYRSWLVRSLAALCMTTVVAWASPGASPVASAALAPYEQTDARWAYTGSWFAHGAPAFSGSSHTFTNVTGAEVTFAFAGTGFDLVSTTGPK